jgi:hypothetical protein
MISLIGIVLSAQVHMTAPLPYPDPWLAPNYQEMHGYLRRESQADRDYEARMYICNKTHNHLD